MKPFTSAKGAHQWSSGCSASLARDSESNPFALQWKSSWFRIYPIWGLQRRWHSFEAKAPSAVSTHVATRDNPPEVQRCFHPCIPVQTKRESPGLQPPSRRTLALHCRQDARQDPPRLSNDTPWPVLGILLLSIAGKMLTRIFLDCLTTHLDQGLGHILALYHRQDACQDPPKSSHNTPWQGTSAREKVWILERMWDRWHGDLWKAAAREM